MPEKCELTCGREKITEDDLPQTFTVKLLGRRDARGLWGIKNTRDPIDGMIATAKEKNLSLPVIHLRVSKEGVLLSPIRAKRITKETPQEQKNANTDITKENIPTSPPTKISVKTSFFGTLKKLGMKGRSCAFNKEVKTAKQQDIITSHIEKHENFVKKPLETNFILLNQMKTRYSACYDRSFLGIDTISYGVQDLVFTRVFSMIVVTEEHGRSPFQCYAFVCEDRHVARCITYSLAAAFQIYSRTIKAARPVVEHHKGTVRKPKILAIDLRTPEQKKCDKEITYSEA